MSRMRKRHLDTSGLTMENAEGIAELLIKQQRDVMWQLADLARYAQHKWPEKYHQIWPEEVSPGMIARAIGVGEAYPKPEDRQHEATWTQYMQVAGKPNRQELLAEMVDKGQTTDESRKKNDKQERWLLAFDVSYFLHRFWHSGAGVESATGVADWIQRTVDRLKEKGVTDVACCLDSPISFRKELTKDWDDKYKDRPPKDKELIHQLNLVVELLQGHGFACVKVDGMEGDDILATYAKQFPGKVTIVTQDKDCRQCLSEKCNMLLDIEWIEDETSGDVKPVYKWMSSKLHTEETGITPQRWPDYQMIRGDPTDGITGAPGIGEKGAKDLIIEFGSVDAAIEAAWSDTPDSSPWKPHTGPKGGKGWKHEETGEIKSGKRPDDRSKTWKALLELADKLSVTRQLVTLRTDLRVPSNTRI